MAAIGVGLGSSSLSSPALEASCEEGSFKWSTPTSESNGGMQMNRIVVFGVAMFFAAIGVALMGSDSAVAGHGGHGCHGAACDGGFAPDCGGHDACCGRRHHRHHRNRCGGGLFSHKHRNRCCGDVAPACCGEVAPACAAPVAYEQAPMQAPGKDFPGQAPAQPFAKEAPGQAPAQAPAQAPGKDLGPAPAPVK
jgi:hypothetical protein